MSSSQAVPSVEPAKKAGKNIVIFTIGSRGDIQPYIVLALALIERGHNVTLGIEECVKSYAEEFHVPYATLYGDTIGYFNLPEAKVAVASGDFWKIVPVVKKWEAQQSTRAKFDSYLSVARACKADILVCGNLSIYPSLCVAELLNVPWILVTLTQGAYPTSLHTHWAVTHLVPFSCLNRWSYNYTAAMMWEHRRKHVNEFRESLGLAGWPWKGRGSQDVLVNAGPTILEAVSPLLCGRGGLPPGDYPPNVTMAGFIMLPDKYSPPPPQALQDFLDLHGKGLQPIVSVGFGSMPVVDPAKVLEAILHACTTLGCKAVLIAGWAELTTDPACKSMLSAPGVDSLLCITKSAPHSWLFPQMTAIVHHCGAGTLAASLRAGVPQVPCPLAFDQTWNSKRMVDLGVAPRFIPFRKLNKWTLCAALKPILADKGRTGPVWRAARERAAHVQKEHERALDIYCTKIETAKPVAHPVYPQPKQVKKVPTSAVPGTSADSSVSTGTSTAPLLAA